MSIRNMAKSAKNIRAKMQKEKESGGKGKKNDPRRLNYFDMKEGEKLKIRFLPDAETGEYWLEYATHGPNLKLRGLDSISCAYTSNGEDCPACAHSFEFYEEGDKTQAQRWRRKETYIGQVLVTDDNPCIEVPEAEDGNPVKLMFIPWGIIEAIQEAIMEERIGEIIDHDFYIKKTSSKGGQASYSKSYFVETESVLDDEILDMFEDDDSPVRLFDLSEELPAPSTTDEVEEWLDKAIELDEKTSRRRSSGKAGGRKRAAAKDDGDDGDDDQTTSAAEPEAEEKSTKKVGKSSLMERLAKKQAAKEEA